MEKHRADELALLRAEVAALRARVERPRRRPTPRRLLPLGIVTLLVALVPLATLAAEPVFTDLGQAAPVHQPNIRTIGAAGITTGVEDPANPGQRLYFPKDNVTREEMASFLARTAGLGGNPPIANALTAQSATTAQTLATNPAGSIAYAANDLTRIAFNNDATASTPVKINATGQTTIVSLPLTTTQPGYVRVSFSSLLLVPDPGTGCPCSIRAYIQQDSGTVQPVKRIDIGNNFVDGFDRRDITGTYVFSAPAGGHTYKLIMEQIIGTSEDLTISYPNVQAEFFPFGATGAGATELP